MTHPLEHVHPRNLKTLTRDLRGLIETRLWAQILLGMVAGIGAGLALGPSTGWVDTETAVIIGEWLALPGELFLVVIQMIVIPLVLSSVILGMASSGDMRQLRSTGVGLTAYFLVTTLIATALGITIGLTVRPGDMVAPEVRASLSGDAPPPEGIEPLSTGVEASEVPAAIVGLLPQNPLGAMVQGEMLQVVLFSVLLGIALISIEPESSRPLLDLMTSLQKVSMRIVSMVMRLAPFAVFGLLARAMLKTGPGVLIGLGVYALAVFGALVGLLALYLAIVASLGRRNPFTFLGHIRDAQLLAFSTGSSAATMPVSIQVAEEKLGVRPSTAQLVVPMGATVNMGGTACYHGVATLFMAQLFGMDLPLGALLALMVTSLGSSIGAPATPGVGIMILATVLTAADVPLAGITLVIGLDQILERMRCVMNVSGDLVACVVMDRFGGAPRSREEELAQEAEIEELRTGQPGDVVTT